MNRSKLFLYILTWYLRICKIISLCFRDPWWLITTFWQKNKFLNFLWFWLLCQLTGQKKSPKFLLLTCQLLNLIQVYIFRRESLQRTLRALECQGYRSSPSRTTSSRTFRDRADLVFIGHAFFISATLRLPRPYCN